MSKQMYWMMGPGMQTPKGSTNLEILAKDADQIKGVILTLSERYRYDRPVRPDDYDIVYVGGESKYLTSIR